MKEWLLKNGWTEFMDFIRHPDLDFHFAVKYKRFVLFGVPLLVRNQNEVEAIIAALDEKCLYRSGMRVKLNLNNGMIATAKSQSNRLALTACAVSLIADYCCRHDQRGNELLKFAFADFAQAIGGLVKDYSEGKNDAKSAI